MARRGCEEAPVRRERAREPDRNFGNSLPEEARRSLALVDNQLSMTSRLIFPLLGMLCIVAGVGLFSWTLTRSQNIPTGSSFGGWNLFTLVFVALAIREIYRGTTSGARGS